MVRVPTRQDHEHHARGGNAAARVRDVDGSRAARQPARGELEERLSRIEIRPLTARTVNDKDALRAASTVRKQGYAVIDQELEEGLRSLAVPIRDAREHVIAALNVSVHATRASMAMLRRDFLPFARQAVAGIQVDLRSARTRGAAFTRPDA